METCLRVLKSFLLVGLFAVPAPAGEFDGTVQEFDAPLIGEWVVRSSNMAGKKGRASPATTRIQITKKRVLLINGGKTELALDCRLDESKHPKEIDLAFELEKGAGPVKMNVKGIFKVDRGRITLCFNGDPRGDRPTDFKEATKENGLMVFELEGAAKSK